MINFKDIIADEAALAELPVTDLASILFFFLKKLRDPNRLDSSTILKEIAREYNVREPERSLRILIEAWALLEHEGLIATEPQSIGEWQFITRRGYSIKDTADMMSYTLGALLPDRLLHLTILEEVKPLFLSGKYETAVFEAFRQVEIKVREGAELPPEDYGVPLMRKAFNDETGVLRDQSLPVSERKAMADLFAGATGLFKNPASHRRLRLTGAEHAAAQILIANELLSMATERSVGLYHGVDRPEQQAAAE